MWGRPHRASGTDNGLKGYRSNPALKTRWSADGEEGHAEKRSRESWTGKTAGFLHLADLCLLSRRRAQRTEITGWAAGMPESGWLLPLKNAGNKRKTGKG